MSLTLTAAVRTNKPKRNVNIISAANGFSLAIQKNGRAFGWGTNSNGQIGNNSSVSRFTPVSILGTIKTFCVISGGSTSSCALDKNGKAWAWGSNANGRLGDGTLNNRLTPVSVYGNKTFCKISGNAHTLAIDKYGRAWGWGINNAGRIGDNSITQRLTPVSIVGTVKTFCKISAGGQHSHAIDKNGRLWGWGNNERGQVGNNSIASQLTPVSVAGAIKTFCEISTTFGDHSIAIDKNGRLWGWGFNSVGQLGINSTSSARTPTSVLGAAKTFCKISAGALHCLALDKNGRAWGWGYNRFGQIGDDSLASRLTPVSVLGAVKTFCQISAGTYHSLAIDKNGRAWGWGYNSNGELGNNKAGPTYVMTPVSVAGAAKTFCAISFGLDNHALALDKNGRAWAWGSNQYGRLGNVSTSIQITPFSVYGNKTFSVISAGALHSIAIDKNGRAWAWGYNIFGQIGDNSVTSRLTPVSVAGAIKTFCRISAGYYHSVALDKNGRAWGWGYNFLGEVGDNTVTKRLTPVSVAGAVKTFCNINASLYYSLAIDKNGRSWAWGYNGYGQLGDGSVTSRLTPVSVAGAVKTFCKISGGYYHSLAIDKNGRAWAWGVNFYGQIGDNSVTSRLTPVSVAGAIKTFCQISAGAFHSIAIDKNGRAWGWGYGNQGQLGNNSISLYLSPVSVAGAVKTFCTISAGYNNSSAVDKNGKVWTWGLNNNGNLGNNVMTYAMTPVQVCNI